jgi:predicted ferric reductase
MNYKRFLVRLVIVVLAIIPVLLVITNTPGKFSDYNSITYTLGQIAGLVGMTLFAITFILSTRMKFIEDAFGGLDKVYVVHKDLGAIALILILFHPLLLVLKYIPKNIKLAANYLLPGSYWSINFGIIALVGLIILICLTLYVGMKYNNWKFSHEFMGLVFIMAVLHIFLIRGTLSKDNIFHGYYVYVFVVALIGLGGFLYSLLLRSKIVSGELYKIKSLNKRGKDVYEIILSPENKPLKYKSGQFVFVVFKNKKIGNEQHPFSIASASNDSSIRIIVKGLGDFTHKLSNLNIGDKVYVEGPYGRFNYERTGREQIWIAGGIGITPFIGMAEDLALNPNIKNKVELYYTARSHEDLIYIDKLREYESKNNSLKVIPWVSSEKGLIKIKDIEKMSKDLGNKEFFICGPEKLKIDMEKDLINMGIRKDLIHKEEFGFK